MKKKIVLIGFSGILYLQSYSQVVSVRKAFESKTDDDNNPAILSFTGIKGKPNSFLINAGLGLDILKLKPIKTQIGGFFVYNKNTQIAKEQHNYQLGITGKTIIGGNPEWSIIGNHTLQYKRDYIDTNHSVIATTYWHPFSKKENGVNWGGYSNPKKAFSYFLQLQLGLEYQKLIDTKQKNLSDEGHDFRNYISLGGNLLLRTKLDTSLKAPRRTKFLELVTSYDLRTTIISNIFNNVANKYLFKIGVNLYPAKSDNFSLGVSYNNGENPIAGIKKQEYWTIAFQYKLN